MKQLLAKDPYSVFEPLWARPEEGTYFLRLDAAGSRNRAFLLKISGSADASIRKLDKPGHEELEQFVAEACKGKDPGDVWKSSGAIDKMFCRFASKNKCGFGEAVVKCFSLYQSREKGTSVDEEKARNAIVKFLCWAKRYRGIFDLCGAEVAPKILYEGTPDIHEIQFLWIMQQCGADVILVLSDGGKMYAKADPLNLFSFPCLDGMFQDENKGREHMPHVASVVREGQKVFFIAGGIDPVTEDEQKAMDRICPGLHPDKMVLAVTEEWTPCYKKARDGFISGMDWYCHFFKGKVGLDQIRKAAITVLCWMKRYLPDWQPGSSVVYIGKCGGVEEAFLRAMEKTGVTTKDIDGRSLFGKKPVTGPLMDSSLRSFLHTWSMDASYRNGYDPVKGIGPSIRAGIVTESREECGRLAKLACTGNTVLWASLPHNAPGKYSSFAVREAEMLYGGKLDRRAAMTAPWNRFKNAGQDIQDRVYDTVDMLITIQAVKTASGGLNYGAAAAAILGMDKELAALVMEYDFARSVPKLVILGQPAERGCSGSLSFWDSAVVAFLSLYGFDVLYLTLAGQERPEEYLRSGFFKRFKYADGKVYPEENPDKKQYKANNLDAGKKGFETGRRDSAGFPVPRQETDNVLPLIKDPGTGEDKRIALQGPEPDSDAADKRRVSREEDLAGIKEIQAVSLLQPHEIHYPEHRSHNRHGHSRGKKQSLMAAAITSHAQNHIPMKKNVAGAIDAGKNTGERRLPPDKNNARFIRIQKAIVKARTVLI